MLERWVSGGRFVGRERGEYVLSPERSLTKMGKVSGCGGVVEGMEAEEEERVGRMLGEALW